MNPTLGLRWSVLAWALILLTAGAFFLIRAQWQTIYSVYPASPRYAHAHSRVILPLEWLDPDRELLHLDQAPNLERLRALGGSLCAAAWVMLFFAAARSRRWAPVCAMFLSASLCLAFTISPGFLPNVGDEWAPSQFWVAGMVAATGIFVLILLRQPAAPPPPPRSRPWSVICPIALAILITARYLLPPYYEARNRQMGLASDSLLAQVYALNSPQLSPQQVAQNLHLSIPTPSPQHAWGWILENPATGGQVDMVPTPQLDEHTWYVWLRLPPWPPTMLRVFALTCMVLAPVAVLIWLMLLLCALVLPSHRPRFIAPLIFAGLTALAASIPMPLMLSAVDSRFLLPPDWLAPLLIVPIVLCLIPRHRRHTAAHPLCTRCRYDLTGNLSGICPECGTPIHAVVQADYAQQLRAIEFPPDTPALDS